MTWLGGNMGIGFAIPVSTARHVLESLVREGRVTRGWIGVEPQDLNPELAASFKLPATNGAPLQGVVITGVLQNGPAAKAGIRPGDVVWFEPGEKHWHGAGAATANQPAVQASSMAKTGQAHQPRNSKK